MRIVLQKVTEASVSIQEKTVGSISHGFLILLGITHGDTRADVDWLVKKIVGLRLFADEGRQSFMEKNIQDVQGSLLVVSQFTLYGSAKKGTRPSFTDAAPPQAAEPLYQYMLEALSAEGVAVESGEFGAEMQVSLTNDGPVTLIIDTPAK